MDPIVKVLVAYYNEDPEAFDGVSGAGYGRHTLAQNVVGKLHDTAYEDAKEDATGWGLSNLLADILNALTEDQVNELDKHLTS